MIGQDGGSWPCRIATRSGPDISSQASANNNEEEKKWARLTTHTSKVTYRCYFPVLTELVLRRHTGPGPSCQGKISSRDEKVRGFHGGSPTNAGGDERDRTADLFVANEALSQLSYTPNISLLLLCFSGGEAGIRTLGTSKCSTVFETAPFNHSGTSPKYICASGHSPIWTAGWRRGRDSNPRYLAAHTISSRAD